MKFLNGLSDDIKHSLLSGLKTLWTHESTAIEGNTLTLGETDFIIKEGLTISGKPLKDHRDIEGHARAVDLIFSMVKKTTPIDQEDIFNLHRLIITERTLDVYKPVGDWKKEDNSTDMAVNGKVNFITYSRHYETKKLMNNWINYLNLQTNCITDKDAAIIAYAKLHISFVSIHPFYDGNGRIARLISNIPCLKAGYPPVIIDSANKYEYKNKLAQYQLAHGVPTLKSPLINEGEYLDAFIEQCRLNMKSSIALIQNAHKIQREQNSITL